LCARRLWTVLGSLYGYGKLWMALRGFGRLWRLWALLGSQCGPGRLWATLGGSGRLRAILDGSGVALGGSSQVLAALGRSGPF
jgi:hypothetical protein